jgi:hypothetical protein
MALSDESRPLELHSINANYAVGLFDVSSRSLTSVSTEAANALGATAAGLTAEAVSASPAFHQLHFTTAGDLLASSSFAAGSSGDVTLSGSIGAIPYELHIHVALEEAVVSLTLTLTKPLQLGPYTWRFHLGGVIRNNADEIVGAATITPAPDLDAVDASGAAATMAGFKFLCVLKCGGITFLPILIKCLPALISGGPAGFIACITASLGTGAAGVAACVAEKCLK